MANLSCAVCEDPVGDEYVEIDEDPVLEAPNEDETAWVAHTECWRRHQSSLDQLHRMFESLDRDYEAPTDIEGAPATNVDEDELDAEIEDIEETLNEILDEGNNDEA